MFDQKRQTLLYLFMIFMCLLCCEFACVNKVNNKHKRPWEITFSLLDQGRCIEGSFKLLKLLKIEWFCHTLEQACSTFLKRGPNLEIHISWRAKNVSVLKILHLLKKLVLVYRIVIFFYDEKVFEIFAKYTHNLVIDIRVIYSTMNIKEWYHNKVI